MQLQTGGDDHPYGGSHRGGFYHWVTHIRLSRLIATVLIILIAVPLVTHYYISNISGDDVQDGDIYRSRNVREHEEISSARVSDLKFQIDELKNIKASANNELKELENKRQKLLAEIGGYNTHIDQLKSLYERTHYDLEQLKMTIENTKAEQEELIMRNMPQVQAPYRILPSMIDGQPLAPPSSPGRCAMETCFDFSRCSLTSQFPVYIYDPNDPAYSSWQLEMFIKLSVAHAFEASPHRTYDPHSACVYVVLVGDKEPGLGVDSLALQKSLHSLPYWNGDGRNHVLLNIARSPGNHDMFHGVDTGRAMIAQSAHTLYDFRDGFDLVLPPSLGLAHGDTWDQLQPIVRAKRKHLLSFHGDYSRTLTAQSPLWRSSNLNTEGKQSMIEGDKNAKDGVAPYIKQGMSNLSFQNTKGVISDNVYNKQQELPKDINPHIMPHYRNLKSIDGMRKKSHSQPKSETEMLLSVEYKVMEALKLMQTHYPNDGFAFQFSCDSERIAGLSGEWALCGTDSARKELLQQSTFSLVIAPTNYSIASTVLTQIRVYEALKYGAIPVILGDYTRLPFAEVLQWKQASVALPKSRITELHLYLRSFPDSDIIEMRRRGRMFWESYFGTTQSIVHTLLAVLRTRLNIPAFPAHEERSPSVFNASFVPLSDEIPDQFGQSEDVLGPIETPFPSLRYQRNFTQTEDVFNTPGDPFHSYPFTPFDPILPAEAKFLGSGLGFRPIGKGAGGAGQEFAQALGGNVPREQFTVVVLTYEREAVLISALARLKGLPHLNKVVVVWNNPNPPASDLVWPKIGVEIAVVRTARNSLNNRFLPYDAIETEAILSIDDDAHLRHDEIMFGFRVWRENRERIVGFPGRFHAWDLKNNAWLYNSNYSCELSMVLTGAAFFHKYYAYLYSYVMPQAIRDKVDEYLNCEDLAMNFLVSHITRKPPIKVTSRWTFRCPGCNDALSVDVSHFQERHKCINFFVQVYGYMPLLYTQYRVDSVLFKTRLPHDKQKCFKFI